MDGTRVHLIERAAVQLDRTAALAGSSAPAAVAEVAERVRPSSDAAVAVEQGKPSAGSSSLVIERATLERAGMVDWDAPSNRVAEEFRIVSLEVVRRSLAPNQDGLSGSNLIMITSAVPAEGKSFTALNLAGGIARSGQQRVLLVDADGKTGSLSDLLLGEGSGAPGLIDLAADGRIEASDLVVQSRVSNLEFLPFGSGAANRAGVLGNLAGVIEDLGRRVDRLIIFDAPPCLSTSRPHLLAPVVGQAVLVVAAASTQQNDIEAALGLIQSCPRVSLLLNKLSQWNAHSFGSYAYSS